MEDAIGWRKLGSSNAAKAAAMDRGQEYPAHWRALVRALSGCCGVTLKHTSKQLSATACPKG